MFYMNVLVNSVSLIKSQFVISNLNKLMTWLMNTGMPNIIVLLAFTNITEGITIIITFSIKSLQ